MANWKPSDRSKYLFWRKVNKAAPNGCWEWRGIPDEKGYGHATLEGWRTTAHRISFAIANGVSGIESGLVVMHKCDNRLCCNPDHLQLGTQKENLDDMRAKGRAGDSRVFGERHGMTKVSDAQVAEIIARYQAGGISQQALADEYGLGQSQVGRIVNGRGRVRLAAAAE